MPTVRLDLQALSRGEIINTFNLKFPYTKLPTTSPEAAAGIRAQNGVLYGANGKPIVLKVS